MKFLLIVALCLTCLCAEKSKILVVVSSSDYITLADGTKHKTGFFLSELTIPVMALLKANYEIVFANPKGNTPTMDAVGDNIQYFSSKEEHQQAKELIKIQSFINPRKLSDITEKELEGFKGVFFPGGHAPMEDLCRDINVGRVLKHFHKYQKPTALICHGPIALLSAQNENGWIYKDYKMTIFSDDEEKFAQENILHGKMKVLPSQALKNAGGELSHAKSWTSHAVRDRELITGQNPNSDHELTHLFLEALVKQKISGKKITAWDKTTRMQVDTLYNASTGNPNWQGDGHIVIYIGCKKDDSSKNFIKQLQAHVNMARKSFKENGCEGYVVYATQDIEIAYLWWTDLQTMKDFFGSELGQACMNDAKSFMDDVLFTAVSEKPVWLNEK
ncbi:type 1 glutamine amidotransferase domain-containing protein [Candidatus Uabimicrobium sp. HlEnr_7]|uniref:type 1 glutamine amidotransferase domain-containing protein n=1 Tax=Candidatus Uabimicrobium helgolandensis TaxID=3095367 RepID=UPI003557C867